ncbi:MAG: alpha/beta hydrolase-fold protein [Pseudobacter sp.]|uniref:alpha/beta hydrolase-fold protein n=1 Tax=Pseudobacter sp. TaxID=2045420 RepID=UPI003F8208EB
MLIGHSLGGLMAMHVLLNHTSLFNKYAAMDPAMWWDDQKLLIQAKHVLAKKSFTSNSLYLAIANTRNKNIKDVSQLRKDTSRETALIRPSLTLADLIHENRKNQLIFNWKYYKEFDHMSVVPSAAYDALKFLVR